MNVNLTYFRPNKHIDGARFWGSGSFQTKNDIVDITYVREQVSYMRRKLQLPGLDAYRHKEVMVLVDVPEHPDNEPYIVLIDDPA